MTSKLNKEAHLVPHKSKTLNFTVHMFNENNVADNPVRSRNDPPIYVTPIHYYFAQFA